nr:nuclear transport factor 2 family protein [Acidobacteriota bacterium]
EQIIAAEKRVIWEAVKKKQTDVLRESLAEDYLDVSDVGVFNKSETLQLIPELNLRDYSLDKFKVIKAGRDTAVVTYEAIQHWTLKGQEGSSHVRASSLWVERKGKWLIVFHQESTLG